MSWVYDIATGANPTEGRALIEWARHSMPVLGQISARFATQRPLEGVRIAACLHVTAETANLMRTLRAGGADVRLSASNPLATQDDVAAALVDEFGISVFAQGGVDQEAYHRHIDAALDVTPELILDDACDLINALHTRRIDLLDHVRIGLEETTTGVLQLHRMAADGALKFPVIAVNDTGTSRMFDNRYGTGQSTMDAIFRATNLLLAGKTVVVAGYGDCGKGVADRARGLGANVVVTEVDPVRALDAAMQGFRVLPMAEAAPDGDVFITVTGNRDVLCKEHFDVMKDGVILANSGHFDIEIDVPALESMARGKREQVRPQTDEYAMPDGRRIMLLAQGRLANLGAAEGHPPAVMDMSFAVQALTVERLVAEPEGVRLEPGVYDTPADIDKEVARLELASMGASIDTLTPDQRDYLTSWEGSV